MKTKISQRETFGRVSGLYEKSRVSYPQQLIEDIIAFSKITKNGKILDIGCGTGQLTLIFAQKGFTITGLDISRNMVNLAQNKCLKFSNVDFKIGSFEKVKFPENKFDLIVSGMAWHWVTSENRYDKINKLLKKGGTLALCWNYQYGETKFRQEVGLILDKYGKSEGQTGPKIPSYAQSAYDDLKKNILFNSITQKEYCEDILFSPQKYLNLVLTYHWVQLLPKTQRNKLIKDFQELYKKCGKTLTIPYHYILILAKKK